MITITRRHRSTHRRFFLACFSFIMIGLFVIGSLAFHLLDTSLMSTAHAAATTEKTTTHAHVPTPCASDPTGPHCTNQDPMTQGCSRDVQTLSFREIPNKEGTILATVQRRFSSLCHSEWGRIIASPGNHQPISIIIGTNGIQASAGPIAFTTMIFVPNLSRASEIKGTISTNGITPGQANSAGLTVILPALSSPPQ